MRRSLGLAAAALALATAGCAPTVRELETAQAAAAAGDRAANADRAVDCAPAEEGCGRLFEIKADACLRLAQAALAEGRAVEAAPRAACASDAYARAAEAPGADAVSLRARMLEATRLTRETTAGDRAAEANAALAALAADAPPPEGPRYRADAALWRAAFATGADAAGDGGCADLGLARRLAAAAQAGPSDPSPLPGDARAEAAALERRAAALAARRGCP